MTTTRPIELRAWIKPLSIYATDLWTKHTSYGFPSRYTALDQCSGSKDSYEGDDLTLEQFTGILDSNGCGIYEGDIVKGSWGYSGIVTLENIFYAQAECTIPDDLDITGNIHE